jgi:hypothetical protein
MICRVRPDQTLRSTARILAFGLPQAIITIFPKFNYLLEIRGPAWDRGADAIMTAQPGHKVTLKLNQQQIELIERTIARGAAPDIEGLVRRALREYAARHPRDLEK